MDFKNNLRLLMNLKSINNNQLARKIEVSRSLITHYLNGTKEPKLPTLEKIKNVLDCTYDDLLK